MPETTTSTSREVPDVVPVHKRDDLPETELFARIVEAIREIYDPEIPVNVYDLGLIYDIAIDENDHVFVLMTLTAPNCPAAGILPGQVEDAVRFVEGVASVELELTFDPPFTPDMMTEEAQLELGFM
jgi:FeS assembly SUF system protein